MNNQSGFTTVEVIIVITAVCGFIALGSTLYVLIHFLLKVW